MKQPKKPTYNQKRLMSRKGLGWKAWAVIREDRGRLELIHRETGQRKTIEG